MNEHVHCKECGSVLPELGTRIAYLEEQLGLAEKELRGKRSQIARLTKQQADERPPEFEDAMEIAEYWRELCSPRARELNGPRLQNTIQRLRHGYPKAELKLAVWGYSIRPNVRDGRRVRPEQGGERHVDLELIMRGGKQVDAGIAIAEQEGKCDHCGHPQMAHAMIESEGHSACRQCACPAYDDTTQAAEAWVARRDEEGRRKRALQARRPHPQPPTQERLL